MANDMKSGIGFLIPGAGVIGFFTSLLLGEFLISIIIAISGILVWFLYMLVMEWKACDLLEEEARASRFDLTRWFNWSLYNDY